MTLKYYHKGIKDHRGLMRPIEGMIPASVHYTVVWLPEGKYRVMCYSAGDKEPVGIGNKVFDGEQDARLEAILDGTRVLNECPRIRMFSLEDGVKEAKR